MYVLEMDWPGKRKGGKSKREAGQRKMQRTRWKLT